MEIEKVRNAILAISEAYSELDEAKENCDVIVESTLEELAMSTAIRKEDAQNIKKMAKAISAQKREKLIAEANSLSEICGIFE